MDFIKKLLQTNQERGRASIQITVENDFNLPDYEPDMIKLIDRKGSTRIHETRVEPDQVVVNGALLFQAHPCRPGLSPRDPKFLDGIEVYNGNPRHESNNPRARAWAEEHHLLFSSGSDYHETEDIARGGMIFPGEIHNSKELAAALAKGVGELIET